MKPASLDGVTTGDVIAGLQKGLVIFLDLTGLDQDNRLRLTDFIAGAAVMCGGNIRKVQENCYVAAPANVDWVGILEDN